LESHAYSFELIGGILYFPVGFRLLWTSLRGGGAPERLLGIALVCAGLTYLLYILPNFSPFEAWYIPMIVAGRVVFGITCVALAMFSQRAFRPDQRWAKCLTWAIAALFAVSIGCSIWAGDSEGVDLTSPWFWCEWAGMIIPSAWIGREGLIHYVMATRKFDLGLIDRAGCHRFLLWGAFGGMQLLATLTLLPMYFEYGESQQVSVMADALLGGFEILSVMFVWLAFYPPDFYYRRFMQDTDAGEQNAQSS
jgi:hypothetical protein